MVAEDIRRHGIKALYRVSEPTLTYHQAETSYLVQSPTGWTRWENIPWPLVWRESALPSDQTEYWEHIPYSPNQLTRPKWLHQQTGRNRKSSSRRGAKRRTAPLLTREKCSAYCLEKCLKAIRLELERQKLEKKLWSSRSPKTFCKQPIWGTHVWEQSITCSTWNSGITCWSWDRTILWCFITSVSDQLSHASTKPMREQGGFSPKITFHNSRRDWSSCDNCGEMGRYDYACTEPVQYWKEDAAAKSPYKGTGKGSPAKK